MASNLRARLAQISSAGSAKPRSIVQLSGPTHVEHAHVADERLYHIDAGALARLGFSEDWPGIERALFLDTETTGLSRGAGTIAFMIGLGYVRDGAFLIEQHMVGDYPDEPQMIKYVAELAKDFDVIVSFNGKTFDVPLLESRAVMCRMPPLFDGHRQLDLMHPSRRVWKRRLGSCRLAALEEQILCSGRTNDLPGSEAPKRFFEYLETGNLRLLDDVLEHNRLDIASLGTLLIALLEAYGAPDQLAELPDLCSMGRAMERIGEREWAMRCYQRAATPRAAITAKDLRSDQYTAEANMALSLMARRAGDIEGAERIWEQMARRGQLGAWPHIELAKLSEHRYKQPARALEYAQSALLLSSDAAETGQIERRIARLRDKLTRGNTKPD